MHAVIATTPAGMLEAQTTMQSWIDTKLTDAKRELSTAESVFNSLNRAKLLTAKASTQIRKARTRIAFYEKVKAALDAGYYIIPPFDVQLFAIRTDRDAPPSEPSRRSQPIDQEPRRLPMGQGDFVDPRPRREYYNTETEKNPNGSEREITIYDNRQGWGGVDLPVRAMKPTIIEATQKALGEKIFDALGIAPAYRSADPLIVGQIKHYKQYHAPLTFFIAWWMDEGDL